MEYISRLTAQKRLGCSKDDINRLLEEGKISSYVDEDRRIRVSVKSLEAYMRIISLHGSAEQETEQDSIYFDHSDHETWLLARIDKNILHKIQNSTLWKREKYIDIPLTEGQVLSLARGYAPDWNCRYAPYLLNGWFYITRSGHWLKKFKYSKSEDGFYHLTSMYTTKKEKGRNLLTEVLCGGYFCPKILDERLKEIMKQFPPEFE